MERKIRDEIIAKIEKESIRICSNILDFDIDKHFSKNNMEYLAEKCFEASTNLVRDVFLSVCGVDK